MKKWFMMFGIATICLLVFDNSLKMEMTEEEIPGMLEASEEGDSI